MRDTPADIAATTWRNAPLAAAAIAAVSHVLLHLTGTAITQDGWAYWQGAVNLAEQGRYTYFSGDPILAWPPLYSLYLAIWVMVLGPAAATLVAANGVLVVMQALLWMRLAMVLGRDGGFDIRPAAALTAAVFLGLFVALNGRWVLAHNLLYALLPVLILAAWRLSHEVAGAPSRTTGLFWLSAAGALLTHNAAAVFVIAALSAIVLQTRGSLLARFVMAAFLAVPPVAAWGLSRWVLGQTGSHAMGAGRESWHTYAAQAASGVGELIAPAALAPAGAMLLVALAVVTLARPASALAQFLAVFTGVALAALVMLFSLTWVNDPLAGRFVAFVPLLVVPVAVLASVRVNTLLLGAVAAALIPLQAWRVAKWSFDNPHEANPVVFVPIGAEISRSAPPGSITDEGGRPRIGPSLWQEQRGRTD